MESIGLCLFLPRRAQFAAAAPSFVEAVAGAPTDSPAREAMEQATSLLHRLTADTAVVPLNLFGVASAFGVRGGGAVVVGASDQPDFLVTREAMPDVFSLIGGRNWKSGPGTKASPLVLEIWKQLDGGGAQTAAEIQTALGREVTEAAVLRGLVELWHGLRAIPVYDGGTIGAATRWELTQARFAAEMTASQKVAQTTALSSLVALYLEAAVAASTEEVEIFLSPLTARSRVREVVNGLQATRQLGLISVAAQPLLHVAGSLPEFAEVEPQAETERKPGVPRAPLEKRERRFEKRPPFEKRTDLAPGSERKSFERKPYDGAEQKPFQRGDKKPFDRGERKPFERRKGFAARGGERPYGKPDDRRPQSGERKPFGKRPFEKRPFVEKPYGARPSGGTKPFDKERTGERGMRPSFGGTGKFPPRRFGTDPARRWEERGGGREGAREQGRESERGARRPDGEKKFGARKPFGGPKKYDGPERFRGAKKFGAGKPGDEKKFGAGRGFGGRAAEGLERGKLSGKRPFFRERPDRERLAKAGDGEPRRREFDSERRGGARPAKRAGGWKPSGGGFSKTGKPGFKKTGRPAFKSGSKPGFKRDRSGAGGSGAGRSEKPAKFFGKSGKSFGKSPRASGRLGKPFGKPKPGGFKPPFRKRKKEGSGDAE